MRRYLVLFGWLLAGGLFSAWAIMLLTPDNAVMQVVAESEYVSGRLDISPKSDTTHVAWPIDNMAIRAGRGPDQAVSESFKSTLVVRSPVNIEIERIANGNLHLSLRTLPDESVPFIVLVETRAGEITKLASPVHVTAPSPLDQTAKGTAVSLPFQAFDLVIGREPRQSALRPLAILRSGEATVLGRTLAERRVVYATKTIPLNGGDVVTAGEPTSSAKVFVRVDERPGLQVVSRVDAENIKVHGFFTEARTEELDFVDILVNDRILAALWSLMTLALAIAGLAINARQMRSKDQKIHKPDDVPRSNPSPASPVEHPSHRDSGVPAPLPVAAASPDKAPTNSPGNIKIGEISL